MKLVIYLAKTSLIVSNFNQNAFENQNEEMWAEWPPQV